MAVPQIKPDAPKPAPEVVIKHVVIPTAEGWKIESEPGAWHSKKVAGQLFRNNYSTQGDYRHSVVFYTSENASIATMVKKAKAEVRRHLKTEFDNLKILLTQNPNE